MKFGVIVFPGSNCDRDMYNALRDDLGQETVMLWHKDRDLSMFDKDDCIVLPGGFSYGDYLRCGALARFSHMMEQVINFANAGGKVLGVWNYLTARLKEPSTHAAISSLLMLAGLNLDVGVVHDGMTAASVAFG